MSCSTVPESGSARNRSCGAKPDSRCCTSCPEAVGGAPARGFAGDAGSADRSTGPGGERKKKRNETKWCV